MEGDAAGRSTIALWSPALVNQCLGLHSFDDPPFKVILNAVDYADRDQTLDFTPDPKIVIPGETELARMNKERDELVRSIS